MKKLFTCLLAMCMLLGLSGCAKQVQGDDLMEGIAAQTVTGKEADDAFVQSQMRLAVELFQKSVQKSEGENVLISPLSVQLALAMTANGAVGQTREEMEQVLGGDISLEDLNEYLYTYVNGLPSGEKYKLEVANSIWFRDEEGRLQVEEDFLQVNADYYRAAAYKAPFDAQTVKDINHWVKQHTDGMIKEIVKKIEDDVVMYLFNAVVFDAEWATVYEGNEIYNSTFTNVAGQERTVEMMYSMEGTYLKDAQAIGFIKPYKENKYSFVALLPNEGVAISDYIADLTYEGLLETLTGAEHAQVAVNLPKFTYEYELSMNELLKEMGMPTAFSSAEADFSALGKSSRGNLSISEVLHKTFISVDELGTRAGAVTKVEITDESAPMVTYQIRLDRPFVYMIVDNETNLPVFIGAVLDIEK